jgi:hypothetical protein
MKISKYFNASKVDLPSLDELRSRPIDENPVDARVRCKCGKFLGNSNLGGSNGRVNDSLRGECTCLNCTCKMEGTV